MKHTRVGWIIKLTSLALVLYGSALSAAVQDMTVDELNDRLSDANVVVVDVRRGSNSEKIKGSVKIEGNLKTALKKDYDPSQTFVFYCS